MLRDIEKIKKLDGFTKAEIITSLVRYFSAEEVNWLIRHLDTERWKKVKTEMEKADAAETEALHAMLEWRRMIIEKYGDGERVAMVKVPRDEIIRGAELEKAYADAQKRAAALDNKINKLAGI